MSAVMKTYQSSQKKQFDRLKKRRWLPLLQETKFARVSAYMVAKVMGDGNLDALFTCRFAGTIEDLSNLKKLIKENYSLPESSLPLRMRKSKGISYLLQVNDCLFGRYVYALGAPIGNKTKKVFSVPQWIVRSKPLARAFLQGIFDDELATIKLKRNRFIREARFHMTKIKKYQKELTGFISQIKHLTESFSVKCSKIDSPSFQSLQKDGSKTYSQGFRILGNRMNILKFRENIGFRLNEYKKGELNECIDYVNKNYKRKNVGRGFRTPVSTKEIDFAQVDSKIIA